MMEEFKESVLDFLYDYKWIFISMGIAIVLFVTGVILWKMLYNPIKIDFEGEDKDVYVTRTTTLSLGAKAHDKEKSDYTITWTADKGDVKDQGSNQVIWDLPEEAGVYTLTANVGDKVSKSKKVTVIDNKLSEYLSVNTAEVISKDTDSDGFTDDYEKTVSNTDPNKKDTDDDGIYDADEVTLDFNPNQADVQNKEVKYSFENTNKDIKIDLVGNGNLTKTTIDTYKTKTLEELDGAISDLNCIYTEGKLKSATITMKYNKDVVAQKGSQEGNLSLYRVNESSGKFIKIETQVNAGESKLVANVDELGKIFIGDKTKIKENLSTELMFVIDNSGSMYSSDEIAESKSNDVEFKRVTLSNTLIDNLKGDYKFGAGKFTFEYTNLSGFTDNKQEIKKEIEKIKTESEKFTGTYIGEALQGGALQFADQKSVDRRYLILLTDGKDTSNVKGYSSKKLDEAIAVAKSKQVKVITIGLGTEVDKKVLEKISSSTGGVSYYTANASGLQSIFEVISANMNHGLIDVTKDGISDSVLTNNSGFLIKRDGFNFDNFASKTQNEGATYGMALFTKLKYDSTLPKSLGDMSLKKDNSSDIVKAQGYSVSLDESEDLYDHKFDKFNFISEESKKLRGAPSGGIVKLKAVYAKSVADTGFLTYNVDVNKSAASGFNKYESYLLDFENEVFTKQSNRTDKEILKAIYRMDILKYKDETISFEETPNKAMDKLKEILSANSPVILKLNGNNYSVLATKLIFDDLNPNRILIEVYDPNDSGIVKYIEVERVKLDRLNEEEIKAGGEFIYKFKYNGKYVNVLISIPNVYVNL